MQKIIQTCALLYSLPCSCCVVFLLCFFCFSQNLALALPNLVCTSVSSRKEPASNLDRTPQAYNFEKKQKKRCQSRENMQEWLDTGHISSNLLNTEGILTDIHKNKVKNNNFRASLFSFTSLSIYEFFFLCVCAKCNYGLEWVWYIMNLYDN